VGFCSERTMIKGIRSNVKCAIAATAFAAIIIGKVVLSEVKQASLKQVAIRPIDF